MVCGSHLSARVIPFALMATLAPLFETVGDRDLYRNPRRAGARLRVTHGWPGVALTSAQPSSSSSAFASVRSAVSRPSVNHQ
jgi:hypothetical protein